MDFARDRQPCALPALQRQHPLLCKGITLAIIDDELPQKILLSKLPASIPDGQDFPTRADLEAQFLCFQQKLRGMTRPQGDGWLSPVEPENAANVRLGAP